MKKTFYEAPESSVKDIMYAGLMCASTYNNINDIQEDDDELNFY